LKTSVVTLLCVGLAWLGGASNAVSHASNDDGPRTQSCGTGTACPAGRRPERPRRGLLAAAPGVYVAQTVTGSGDGTACANAKPASFFNTPSNWGLGKAIAPGVTVHLCGTITSLLTFQGSGRSGSPITVRFEPNAKISRPTCDCFDASNRSYITIDGGTNGVIEATANGTGRANQAATRAIDLAPCDNCTVENLTIADVYVMVPSPSDQIDHTQSNAIKASGSNLTISHNRIHDVGWAIFYDGASGDTNIRVDHNDISHMDHGFTLSGEAPGPVWFVDNHVHDMGNWECGGGCHHDGIHCFTVNGGEPNHYSAVYIYGNRFDGTLGASNTAWIFIEGNTGPYATPCADSTSKIWVFDNVARASDQKANNGLFTVASGSTFVYQNTLIGHDTRSGNLFSCCAGNVGPSAFANNVLADSNQFLGLDPAYYQGPSVDSNVYANGNPNGNGWYCDGFLASLARWRRCIGGDTHARFVANAKLDADGRPQPASPLLGAGTNLTSLCVGPLVSLCRDIDGALRPVRMAPDVGAYQLETAAIKPRAIGRAQLGSSRTSVERFYGRKRAVHRRHPLLGVFDTTGTLTATYRRHGGRLEVSYAGRKVAAVTTTSRYYTTPAGFGVGAEASGARLLAGGWRSCGRSFVKLRAGGALAVQLSDGLVSALAVGSRKALRCP
jgi:hypothetical protein